MDGAIRHGRLPQQTYDTGARRIIVRAAGISDGQPLLAMTMKTTLVVLLCCTSAIGFGGYLVGTLPV